MPMLFPYLKYKRILRHALKVFSKKKKQLSESERNAFLNSAEHLKNAIFSKNKDEASKQAIALDSFVKKKMPKTMVDHIVDFVGAILFALIVAFGIREYWFELYEVPTGSMRPTIEELDRLVVSKTTFGLHHPWKNELLFFKPEYLKRNGIIVFTVEDMKVDDADTVYFYLFPGKKRFIKRAMGNPGDTLYFYGGRIYGIDNEGNDITAFNDETYLQKLGISHIHHVPYINFDGRTTLANPLSRGVYGKANFQQMGINLGRLELKDSGTISGEFFNGKEWVKDDPMAIKTEHSAPKSYGEMWGINNYAMARLLNKSEVASFYGKSKAVDAELFLELHHTPNLTQPQPELRRDEWGRVHPMISSFTTLIPLQEEHIAKIQKGLYTARFYVKDGRAYRYTESRRRPQHEEYDPLFPKVPDGLYELENGVAYKIHTAGFRSKLPSEHPLYNSRPSHIQKLFNLGFNFNVIFEPLAEYQPYVPQRFAYYREGDLYVMDKLILTKDDPTLVKFVKDELERQQNSSYIAFVDHAPPQKDGKVDKEFIERFGLKIPQNAVLALGDNYAMSADSRDFGFVPVHNLRGSPTMIFWPFSSRFGSLPQASYPFWTTPSIIIFIILFFIALFLIIYYYLRQKEAHFSKLIEKAKE